MLDYSATYTLSQFTCLRPHDGAFLVENPFNGEHLVLKSPAIFRVLLLLAQGVQLSMLLDGVDAAQRPVLLKILERCEACDLLTRVDENGEAEEDKQPRAHWEYHDLYFHTRSRMGRHQEPFGGTYHLRDRATPPPLCKTVDAPDPIPLHHPDLERLAREDAPLTEVLEGRRSRYRYRAEPLPVDRLGEFLFRCCRIQQVRVGTDGEPFARRVYPSGGGRHPLEVYVAVSACDGLERGLYHYHPLHHHLARVARFTPEVEVLFEGAQRSAGDLPGYPPILFIITARFLRTAWKYQALAYRLIMAELGALYQTMYLVATAMNLAPCALGAGNSDHFACLIGSDYYEETSIGEFILGPRADDEGAL